MNQIIEDQTPTERLKVVRNHFKLNQKNFAHKMGFKPSYYSELEAGKREMTARVLSTLFTLFNVSADWMLSGQGSMFLNTPSHTLVVEAQEAPMQINLKIHLSVNGKTVQL